MKKTAVVLMTLVLSAFIPTQECKLKNGTYYVQYDHPFEQYQSFKLAIQGDVVEVSEPDGKKDARIKWLNPNEFRLIREGQKQDSLSELQKQLLSLEEPYYEITKWRKNRISFVFHRNPHIIIYSGVFIKEK